MIDTPHDFVLHADQLLTMTGWRDKPPLDRSAHDLATAVVERDRHILGVVEDAAITVRDGAIAAIGPFAERPDATLPVRRARLAMPAWIECHTHALFGTETATPSGPSFARAQEFGLRNAGVPYVEILERGGGILSTVRTTRATSDGALRESLVARLARFAQRGIGTVEVKTGYGLALDEELRHLRIIRDAAAQSAVSVVATFLGAHAVPPEWRHDPEGYVDLVVEEMIPAVAEQAVATQCDVFCDRGAFTRAQSERILAAGLDAGLDARIHAEEIVHTGGAEMAARLGALSADHLDNLDEAGVRAMVETGCVGVLLPGVTAFLDLDARAPARALVDGGARIALSTDFNPGSAMTMDLRLMTTLGCTLLKLTPGEALWGVTAGAAAAIGRADSSGILEVGRSADFALFDEPEYAAIPYRMGDSALRPQLVLAGRDVAVVSAR